MNKILLVLLAIFLAGCGNNNNVPPPLPPSTVNVSMNASLWSFQYSPGMPANPTQTGSSWQFSFPSVNGVHYLLYPVNGRLVTAPFASYQILKDAAAVVVENEPCGESNALMRIMLQRRGDNLSGAGEYEFYRWWSMATSSLNIGGEINTSLDGSQWTSVYGKSGTDPAAANGFAAALADLSAIGVTFGGCFAGHGAYVTGGTATFIMQMFGLR